MYCGLVSVLLALALASPNLACIEDEIVKRCKVGEKLAKIQCTESLGVKSSGSIPASSLTASTYWKQHPYHSPRVGRLDADGCWAPDSGEEHWIQVDLGKKSIVTAVTTQGRPTNPSYRQWATQYKVKYAEDNVDDMEFVQESGMVKIFDGNSDFDTHVTNTLDIPILARYVRIYPQSGGPNGWCLRFDLIGC